MLEVLKFLPHGTYWVGLNVHRKGESKKHKLGYKKNKLSINN